MRDKRLIQVIILGLGFMFIFTAFRTTTQVEKTVLENVKRQDASFTGEAYYSLATIYFLLAITSWISPSLVAILHPKRALIATSVCFALFEGNFLYPNAVFLYITSVLVGCVAGTFWTAQGQFLSLVSDKDTITRNAGVFWAINMCNAFPGNVIVYVLFSEAEISPTTRQTVFSIFVGASLIGSTCFCFLKDVRHEKPLESPQAQEAPKVNIANKPLEPAEISAAPDGPTEANVETNSATIDAAKPEPLPNASASQEATTADKEEQKGLVPRPPEPVINEAVTSQSKCRATFSVAWVALKTSVKLLGTLNMILLSVTCFYAGLVQSFYGGIYPTAVSFTLSISKNSKQLMGLVGICNGIGAVTAGSLFGILGKVTQRKGQSPIVILGTVVHTICYVLVAVNLPNGASLAKTRDEAAIHPPNVIVALGCAFLLGFGDSCFITQIMAMCASRFPPHKTTAAFAIFKFMQSLASALAFVITRHIGLLYIVTTFWVVCVVSSVCFCFVEFRMNRIERTKETKQREITASMHSSLSKNIAKPAAGVKATVVQPAIEAISNKGDI